MAPEPVSSGLQMALRVSRQTVDHDLLPFLIYHESFWLLQFLQSVFTDTCGFCAEERMLFVKQQGIKEMTKWGRAGDGLLPLRVDHPCGNRPERVLSSEWRAVASDTLAKLAELLHLWVLAAYLLWREQYVLPERFEMKIVCASPAPKWLLEIQHEPLTLTFSLSDGNSDRLALRAPPPGCWGRHMGFRPRAAQVERQQCGRAQVRRQCSVSSSSCLGR